MSRFCVVWMTKTIKNVTIVVPVLITSCHVSDQAKKGPVTPPRFAADRRRPRAKSLNKLKRTAGHSLSQIIEDLNPTLCGWFEYFKHSHRSTLAPLDGWIRGRLRNIARKQHGRSGISRGYDNIRWPNAFFAEHGLFSLRDAYAYAHQPS